MSNTDKKKRTAKEVWEAIERQAAEDEMDRIQALSSEDLDRELREQGVDPEKVRNEGLELVKRLSERRQAMRWQADAAEGLERERARIARITAALRAEHLSREALLARIEIARNHPRFASPVAVMFRNKTDTPPTDEELLGILAELTALGEKAEESGKP